MLSSDDARLGENKFQDENTPLLGGPQQSRARRSEETTTPIPRLSRHQSATGENLDSYLGFFSIEAAYCIFTLTPQRIGSFRSLRHHNRAGSWGQRLVSALISDSDGAKERQSFIDPDDRVWYDQFTSTDWVHDNIADAFRLKALRSRKDLRGRLEAYFDGIQGWILSALVGFITAVIAYLVDVSEAPFFDLKDGYCSDGWYKSEKTVVPSTYHLSTLDEDLGAVDRRSPSEDEGQSPRRFRSQIDASPMIYYSASGSGVAEVKVILSGFVLHGFLGLKTLIVKTLALILSVASGLSLGKEGPFVHIAACVGNISCRLFSKYDRNDGKRREILSAAAASGVAVAFGAPLGGVLFSLEEASYFFPAKTLFRTFFCCITAALTLKFLNPYGTNKIVMFEVRYLTDWELFEMVPFILLGILGGAAGALFIKASRFWARTFRHIPAVKKWPLVEVMVVALITALIGYWNTFTSSAVAKLLLNLARPCDDHWPGEMDLCPTNAEDIMGVVRELTAGFVIKGFLTIITFGIKVPAGIYVPSMVVGGLLGRIVGHLVQWMVLRYPNAAIFEDCASHASGSSCITPGVYALIAAGATMCGVTRLSVALAVILFELTGSLDYVLPFSLSILVAKWTADAIEPLSIYDLLTSMNSYPFLNNKTKPIFTSDLTDIVPRVRRQRIIDISMSPLVPASNLRQKLRVLQEAGEIDGGLPIIRNHVLVGLIPAPDLEFALDSLPNEDNSLCLMTAVGSFDDEDDQSLADPTDFTPYVDPAPVALDIRSPMDLVYECFAKLGLRYICVLRDGHYAGMLHRKMFVKYVREVEDKEH
ncbi:MAG: hypothetical protein M1818_007149 [Claussenomyces sp. TS43310]|nr:MAG: hypothetical protein M1818_007149 [Claussenomyces sp. TS43310]